MPVRFTFWLFALALAWLPSKGKTSELQASKLLHLAVEGGTHFSRTQYADLGFAVRLSVHGQAGPSICSGSLVTPQIVLTAAHCLDSLGFDPAVSVHLSNAVDIDIALPQGQIDPDFTPEEQMIRYTSSRIMIHPRYRPGLTQLLATANDLHRSPTTLDIIAADIALIRLDSAVSIGAPTAVLIDRPVNSPRQNVQILGFGRMIDDDSSVAGRSLQIGQMQIDPIAGSRTLRLRQFPARALPGDSGAPVLLRDTLGWRVVGVVSAYSRQRQLGAFTVYAAPITASDEWYVRALQQLSGLPLEI